MHAPRRDSGFTYIGLIIMVAIIGVASTASLQVGSIMQRRAAEEALLDIGAEFRNALLSYAAATPVGQSTMPPQLGDLLLDPRYPDPKRHLRKLYVDPITGKPEWGVVTMPSVAGEGIAGVYSLSDAAPIKVGNFDAAYREFEGKKSYRDWKFMAVATTDPTLTQTPTTTLTTTTTTAPTPKMTRAPAVGRAPAPTPIPTPAPPPTARRK